MFQNAWFDKKADSGVRMSEVDKKKYSFIDVNDIEYVRTLYWDEHCLECSAPACYLTCPKYSSRRDKLCKRLVYGMRHEKPEKCFLWKVTVKFREWGKIEARINNGTLSVAELMRQNCKDKVITKVVKAVAFIFSPSDLNISRKWDGMKRKKYATIESKTQFANDFLFQCFSFEKKPYKINFEITNRDNNVIFKKSLQIVPGENQELIKLEFTPPEGGLVRMYPENNLEAEMTILAADFCKMKNSIPSRASKKVKCVAWDLDNTIWDGILAESDQDKLNLRNGVAETIRELDRRGIIQIVVSKNDVGAVEPILQKFGILKYFIYVLSNWNAKSVNIYNAARMLNIHVDTIALIDDSDFERREVSHALPCVRVYSENLDTLLQRSEFDIEINEESVHRRESYLQEASRKQVLAALFAGDNTGFIRDCKIEIQIKEIDTQQEMERSYELLQRTNQLNLSANKYSKSEFKSLMSDDGVSIIAYVKDRYGDYGQVAFIHFRNEEEVKIMEFAMSCRVAAKYVEAGIFHAIQKRFNKELLLIGKKTDRNGTLIDVLNKCCFSSISKDDNRIKMLLQKDTVIPFANINTVIWIDSSDHTRRKEYD